MENSKEFSDYIVYVDESGDHGLKTIDPQYPVFVLVFCIFRKQDYINTAVPLIQSFKFKHFGHDQTILHETDIRKSQKEFSFLKKEIKVGFLDELTEVINEIPFTLVATVIRKTDYQQKHDAPENPYHIALRYGLEHIFSFLQTYESTSKLVHIIVEKRGKIEDGELASEFHRICDANNHHKQLLPFELIFADKKSNSAGLQIADLVARPIGLQVLRPTQQNRAFEIIETKLYQDENGQNIRCFP